MITKVCNDCKQEKDISQFTRQKNSPDGYRYACRICVNTRSLAYYYKHQKRISERVKNLPDHIKKERNRKSANWYKNHPEKFRNNHYLKRFGITLVDFNKLLEEQNGVCAICFKTSRRNKNLSVDHCHETGKVRGLLCWSCNASLGKFNDDEQLLQNAIDYLRKSKADDHD